MGDVWDRQPPASSCQITATLLTAVHCHEGTKMPDAVQTMAMNSTTWGPTYQVQMSAQVCVPEPWMIECELGNYVGL